MRGRPPLPLNIHLTVRGKPYPVLCPLRTEFYTFKEGPLNRRWILWLSLALVSLLLLGCSAESLYLQFYLESQAEALAAPAGNDSNPVTFTVKQGTNVSDIAADLAAAGLISDAELFRRYVQYHALDAGIQAGTYTLRQTMTIPEIAKTLQHANAPEQQVTIPEGKRLEEVSALVNQQTTISAQEFLLLAQTGWRETDLPQKYTFLSTLPITATLEGFLFPDTYRLPEKATAYDLVDRMLATFDQKVTPELRQGITEQGLTLYQGVTLASIVEREAVQDTERPIIAGVYYNRLNSGWFLDACPTVQYALGYRPDEGTWWKHQLLLDDLEVSSPYNTYRNLGLPAGPIASPGLAALQAVAAPASTEYFFFMVDCTKNDGSHAFAQTEDEHLANFNRCGGVISSPVNP